MRVYGKKGEKRRKKDLKRVKTKIKLKNTNNDKLQNYI